MVEKFQGLGFQTGFVEIQKAFDLISPKMPLR